MIEAEEFARYDHLCRAFMDTRPDLRSMSFDEWLQEHSNHLSYEERQAGYSVLVLHPDFRQT